MSLINFLPSGADGTDCSDRNRGLQVEVCVLCIWFKGDVMETIPSWIRSTIISTPPASKSPAPNMDLGAQDQKKNPKSEGLQ